MNKKIIWGIVIAVIVVMIIGVVYGLSYKERALNCCHGEQYEQFPISEWNVYKNDKVGYRVKYPKNWVADNIYSDYSDMTDIILYRPNEIKGDNDVPVEYVSIKLLKSNCEATSSWKESYSEIFEKTKQFEKNTCLNKDLMIKEYALSEYGKQLLEKISATFELTSQTSTVSTSDWKTYTDSINGYQIDYPSNWIVEKNLGVSVRFINPERQGKPDTDIPVEAFGLGFNKTSCKNSEWKEGFGLIFYKSSCISVEKGLYASMSAGDENAKKIEDKILTSFKFTSQKTDVSVNTTPSIKVLSPNGGEKINFDQSYEIKWNNTDVENGGSIYISPKGKDMDKSLVVDRFAYKGQAYTWKAGEVFSSDFKSRVKVTPGEYKIGVCLTKYVNNKSVEECDWSDNYFTITTSANSETITVTVPNGIYKTNFPIIPFTWKSNYSTKQPHAFLWPSQEPVNDGNPTPDGYYKSLIPGSLGGTDSLKINSTISSGTHYKILVCDKGVSRVTLDILSDLCGMSPEFTITN